MIVLVIFLGFEVGGLNVLLIIEFWYKIGIVV